MIGEFQNWLSDPMNSPQSTRCSLFLGLTLDPFKQNKVLHTPFQKQIIGLKLMCNGGIFKEFLSTYVHFWQMTTVVSTCLEKWEFLKFVIIWKAETWLQTQESEYCTSLHCTTLQCNRYKRPAPGQNFNSPQLPLTTIVTPHLFYGLLVTMNKMNKMN